MSKIKDIVQRVSTFLEEVKIELKKVTWPTRKEATAQTYAVIITVVIIAFFLGLVDWFFKFLLIDTLMK
ncbi:preprotein translocase subunit SecE [Thermodesulfobacteriota bacterium]